MAINKLITKMLGSDLSAASHADRHAALRDRSAAIDAELAAEQQKLTVRIHELGSEAEAKKAEHARTLAAADASMVQAFVRDAHATLKPLTAAWTHEGSRNAASALLTQLKNLRARERTELCEPCNRTALIAMNTLIDVAIAQTPALATYFASGMLDHGFEHANARAGFDSASTPAELEIALRIAETYIAQFVKSYAGGVASDLDLERWRLTSALDHAGIAAINERERKRVEAEMAAHQARFAQTNPESNIRAVNIGRF